MIADLTGELLDVAELLARGTVGGAARGRAAVSVRRATDVHVFWRRGLPGLLANAVLDMARRTNKQRPSGMNQRAEQIPAEGKIRLVEALQRLVDLYTATGQTEISEEWRNKLNEAQPKEPEAQP
jgi:hypothetical protein